MIPTTLTTGYKGGGHMGTINFLSKEKADEIASLGFKYTEQKINTEQVLYCFMDTPQLRKEIAGKFAKNDYIFSKTVNF